MRPPALHLWLLIGVAGGAPARVEPARAAPLAAPPARPVPAPALRPPPGVAPRPAAPARPTPTPVPTVDKASCPTARLVLVRLQRCCGGEAWPEAERATTAELRALALKVELVTPPRGRAYRSRYALATLARRRRACGALRISRQRGPAGGRVTVALIDRSTGKATYRDLPLPRSAHAASIVALRVVELLRASLLELRMVDRPHPPVPRPVARVVDAVPLGRVEPTPPPRPLRPVRPRPPPAREAPFGLRLDVAALGSPGGIGALGQLRLALRYRALSWLSLELTAASSVIRAELSYHQVPSSFDIAVMAAWAHWELLTRGRVRASVGVGGGITVPWAVGQPNDQYAHRRDASLTGYVAGTAQLALVLTSRAWVRLSFEAGAALPEVRVAYGSVTVARFGHPLLAGHLGIELRFP